HSVIIATGASYKKLGVKGEEEFTGRGVSYCGVCDAPFFKNKEIALVGGGDTAVYEAEHLLKFVSKLHLVHRRDRLRATKVMQDRVLNNEKTVMHWDSVVEEIVGVKVVDGVRIRNIKTEKIETIPCKGVFVFVGMAPNADFLDIGTFSKTGFIMTGENMQISVPGIFACGDVREKILRQISTAVGEGALAAFAAQQYVEALKGTAYR
ncbi:MAG: FAD-dependent oxidoreductase, partial [Candidatus Omnitrophica bacterium]|nr:FAD-dependent oxidoreductase [Candidatus Omnitrophota bacterium]